MRPSARPRQVRGEPWRHCPSPRSPPAKTPPLSADRRPPGSGTQAKPIGLRPREASGLRETRLPLDRFAPSESYQLILPAGGFGEPPVQPSLGEFQVAVDGGAGNIQKLGRLLIRTAQKESQ